MAFLPRRDPSAVFIPERTAELLVTFTASTRAFEEAMVRAGEVLNRFARVLRKHPRPGWKPRRRARHAPPPWRRAKLSR
jgi:hypothetical protein